MDHSEIVLPTRVHNPSSRQLRSICTRPMVSWGILTLTLDKPKVPIGEDQTG